MWKLYQATGEVDPKPHGGGNPGKLTAAGRAFLQSAVEHYPDATLAQWCERYYKKFGVAIGISSMWEAFHKLNITVKKNSLRQ